MKTESKKSSPPANLLGQQQKGHTAIGHTNKQDHECPEARPPFTAQGTSICTSKSWVSPPSPNYTNTVHRTPLSPSTNKETRNALHSTQDPHWPQKTLSKPPICKLVLLSAFPDTPRKTKKKLHKVAQYARPPITTHRASPPPLAPPLRSWAWQA